MDDEVHLLEIVHAVKVGFGHTVYRADAENLTLDGEAIVAIEGGVAALSKVRLGIRLIGH